MQYHVSAMVSLFSGSHQYHLSGTCKHTLFSFSKESLPNLEIVGDYLFSNLCNGRIEAKLEFINTEDGNVEVRNAAQRLA